MKARRAHLVVAVAVALAALPTGAAHAAGTGQITSPAAGATLTSSTDLVVQVTGEAGTLLDPRDHVVRLRLADRTGAEVVPETSTVAASCQSGECGGDSTWTAGSFDPATLAPFGSRASCNGGYTVQVQVDEGAWTGHGIRIARAPGAPRDVTVTPGELEATVEWAAARDPDVVGYRVERRAGGGSWQPVASVGAGVRSLVDEDVEAGEVGYRVLTLRGDGQVDGAPAAPCADTEPDLATPSAPVGTTVRTASTTSTTSSTPSRPSASSSPSDGSGSGDGGSGTGDGGSDGTGDGSGTGTDDGGGTAADGSGDTSDGASEGTTTPTRRAGNRVAPPTAVGTASRPSVSVPQVPGAGRPQVASRGESYYGEGEEFSEEIDFGDLGAVDAMGEPGTEARVIRVPGALQSVLGEELALDRLLAPIAAGLIMLALGLHLRRWTRAGRVS